MPSIKKQWVQATKNNTMVGSTVRVKLSIAHPRFGWGQVSVGEVGIVSKVYSSDLTIDFSSQSNWAAVYEDLEVLNA